MENKADSTVDENTDEFVVEEGIKKPVSKIEAGHMLWDIAKKYEIALKRKKSIPISESEEDRKKVNELSRKLININEKVIDARALYDLVKMQRFRDKTIILEFMTHKDLIRKIANIVKRRGTPIVSVPGYTIKGTINLIKSPTVSIEENKRETQGFKDEDLQNIKRLIKEVKIIELEDVTTKDLDRIKKQIRQKVDGQCIKIKDLNTLFSPTELGLLSQMIRDETIPSFLLDDNTICFKSTENSGYKDMNFVTVALRSMGGKK